MTEELNSTIYSKQVIEFVTVANEYCNFIENTGSIDVLSLLNTSQKILPLLYLKASIITIVEESEEDSFIENFVTEVDYIYLQGRIRNMLGEYDDYKEVFTEGIEFSEDALTESISESLLDIYQDLKNFIMNYRTADDLVMIEALYECMEHFKQYWGQRLVNVMRAIHVLVYSNIDFDQELNIKLDKKTDEKREIPTWLKGRYDDGI